MAYKSGGRFSQQYFRPLDSKPFAGLRFGRETVNGQWTSPQLYIYSFPLSLSLSQLQFSHKWADAKSENILFSKGFLWKRLKELTNFKHNARFMVSNRILIFPISYSSLKKLCQLGI